jgi:hypothetical protein
MRSNLELRKTKPFYICSQSKWRRIANMAPTRRTLLEIAFLYHIYISRNFISVTSKYKPHYSHFLFLQSMPVSPKTKGKKSFQATYNGGKVEEENSEVASDVPVAAVIPTTKEIISP